MKFRKLFHIHQEILLYLFFGVLTTLINYGCYFISTKLLDIYYIISNILAWIVAVVFAYIVNRSFVFKSKAHGFKEVYVEVTLFMSARIASLAVETFLMFCMVDIGNMNDSLTKILVGIIVVILNYFISKLIIFKARKSF